ncbi:hypothetical protein A9D46_14575 [Photobacterium damselae subsp. damselae]|uniref:hypothetical protein n=1 Tax=Photobacterium damselae TaxID=38293 RepID=UPI00084A4ED4|nr:hypothetical protein [Photobacterium damselae]OEC82404.1 hypothetical protein A9D46_14575 [Photobacterium damselae subsp. damselae]
MFLYPFNQKNGSPYPSQKAFESVLQKESVGHFGFNASNLCWHGGVHVSHNNAPWLKDESPLQAIADGVVVACRISDTYQHSTFEGQTLDYSSDFCLIQHTVANPKQSEETFTFYALYMHLAPLCSPHREVSEHPRYRLRTSQSAKMVEVTGESVSLDKGTIIEATNEEIVKQNGYGFKPFTVIRTSSGQWAEKTVWLAVEKDDPPSDIRRRFLGDAEQYQVLLHDNKAWIEPDLWQPPRSLKRGSRVKALSLEPVRSGDYLMHAYKLLDSEETVWFVTGKYESSSSFFDTYADSYQLPNWLLTKVIARTRTERLSGRSDPKNNTQGELEAGAVAFHLPKDTLLRFDKTQDCSLQKLNGKMRLMARCQLDPTTPVKNSSGQLAREVWVCVEDEFIEVVQADTVALNSLHCFGTRSSLVISAGDAIGYLGRYDVANAEENKPPVTVRHQVHFELLSNEKPPQFFIDMYLGEADKENPYFVLSDISGCDGFLDLDEPSPFFQQLSAHTGKQGTSGFDILRNLVDWDSEKTVIAQHESEWAIKSSEKAFLPKLVEKVNKPRFTALIEHEKERIDNMVWLPEVSKLGLSNNVWNWWPISAKEEVGDDFDLGWLQNTTTQTQSNLWANLFTSDTPIDKQQLIKQSNEHLNDPVRKGEIVIIPAVAPSTNAEKQKLAELKEEALVNSKELAKLTTDEVDIVNRHFELLDYYASKGLNALQSDGIPSDYYAYASLGVGMVATGVEQHLKNINGILLEVNNLYIDRIKNSRSGYINHQQFFEDRAKLLKKLDDSFAGLSKRSVQIPVYQQVKRNLKLSSKSIIHHADEILQRGYVRNIGKRMANVSVGVSATKGVGYVGLVLGAASGMNNIYEACNVDSSGNCEKVTTREIGGFLGGMYLGGLIGDAALAGTVLVLGAASAPVVAVASIGAFVVGGSIGGILGATGGKAMGDILYEKVIDIKEWADNTLDEVL